jgi:hypothetical protein
VLYLLAQAARRLWGLLIDAEYFIPKGSIIFTFRPTAINPSLGDCWIYGEDSHSHYYSENNIRISNQAIEAGQGFLNNDVKQGA